MKLVYLGAYIGSTREGIKRACDTYGKHEKNFLFVVMNTNKEYQRTRKIFVEELDLKLVKVFRYNNYGHSILPWKGPGRIPTYERMTPEEYRKYQLKHPQSKNYLTFYAMEKR